MNLARIAGSLFLLGLLACSSSDGESNRPSGKADASADTSVAGDTMPAGCSDGAQDGDETDVDCGGSCASCADRKSCRRNDDCLSGACSDGYLCRPASCANGEQDDGLGETGVDCGGPCPACVGGSCATDADCAGGYCKAGECDVPTCADGLKNGLETGIDCGGGDCPLCEDGQGCVEGTSCLSGFCKGGHCATATCEDGQRNQGETDVDCGGPCAPCAAGKLCTEASDCESGLCISWRCVEAEPSCEDSEKNGESG